MPAGLAPSADEVLDRIDADSKIASLYPAYEPPACAQFRFAEGFLSHRKTF